jgi:hypothetical protein
LSDWNCDSSLSTTFGHSPYSWNTLCWQSDQARNEHRVLQSEKELKWNMFFSSSHVLQFRSLLQSPCESSFWTCPRPHSCFMAFQCNQVSFVFQLK